MSEIGVLVRPLRTAVRFHPFYIGRHIDKLGRCPSNDALGCKEPDDPDTHVERVYRPPSRAQLSPEGVPDGRFWRKIEVHGCDDTEKHGRRTLGDDIHGGASTRTRLVAKPGRGEGSSAAMSHDTNVNPG